MQLREKDKVLTIFSPMGNRGFWMLLLTVLSFMFSGCLASWLSVPAPQVVRVVHPHQPQPNKSMKELFYAYTTSPNRDPDGQGVLPIFWPQSQATLVVESLARQWEAGNKTAFARNDEQQQTAEETIAKNHRESVVIHTVLFADHPPAADPEWYLPEGIYLLDDKGRKFVPKKITPQDAEFIFHYSLLSTFQTDYKKVGNSVVRFSRLVFPGEAVTKETRALFLYFAAYQRRLRFAWVFDPTYQLPETSTGGDYGTGLKRAFR